MGDFEESILRCPYCQSHASTTLIGAVVTRKCYSCEKKLKLSIYGIFAYLLYIGITSLPIIFVCSFLAVYLLNLDLIKNPIINLIFISITWFLLSVVFFYFWMRLLKNLILVLKARIFKTKIITNT